MKTQNKTSESQAMQDYYDGNENHPGGAPTKYNNAVLTTAIDYLNNFKEHGQNVPTIARLAQLLEITEVTLYQWAKHEDKAELSYTLDRIKQSQKIELIENGLASNYNSNITKLMLYNHGFSEKQQVTGQIQVSKVERSIIDVTPALGHEEIEGETTS